MGTPVGRETVPVEVRPHPPRVRYAVVRMDTGRMSPVYEFWDTRDGAKRQLERMHEHPKPGIEYSIATIVIEED